MISIIVLKAIIIELIAMWIFCDGWYSIVAWMGRPEQSWWKDHSMRFVRMIVSVAIMVIEAYVTVKLLGYY